MMLSTILAIARKCEAWDQRLACYLNWPGAAYHFRWNPALMSTSPSRPDRRLKTPLRRLGQNAPLLLALTMMIWGGNAVAGKFAVGEVSPLLLTAFRWGFAAMVLITIGWRQLRSDWPAIKTRWPYLFALGATGFAAFNGFLYTALHDTTALNATIIQAGMPLFIFVMNFVVFRMNTTLAQIIGFSLTLIGVAVTASRGDMGNLARLAINHGDLLMLLAAFLYSAYSVALRAKPVMHWRSFLTALITAAALTALPMAIYESTTASFIWPHSATGWGVVAFTAIFPSIVAQGFYIRGTELIGSNKAGLYLNLMPIFGAILSVLLLGESFQLYHGLALVLVIGGILIAQKLSHG